MYNISFAPMEGITGRILRKVFEKHFKGVEDYYAPFITPKEKRGIDKKDIREILPENNRGIKLIPQIITNSPEAFNLAAKKLMEYGYNEINLNLGCPSKTVVNKGRGAGALKDKEKLVSLLDVIFSKLCNTGIKVSVKTRIGYDREDEFEHILNIYRKFPIDKLIIHPRTGTQFYKGELHYDSFAQAVREYRMTDEVERLCFNGEINKVEDMDRIAEKFAGIKNIMIGRGLLRYPFLIEDIKGAGSANKKERLKAYLDELFDSYLEEFGGGSACVLKMKEIWSYIKESFKDSEVYMKDIRKAKGAAEYRAAANVIFSNCDVR